MTISTNNMILYLQDYIARRELILTTISKRAEMTIFTCLLNGDNMTLGHLSDFIAYLAKNEVNHKVICKSSRVFVEITTND